MDYILLEQYLSELLPNDAKLIVHSLVDCIKENSWLQFMTAINVIHPAFGHKDVEVRAAAINGFLAGIALSQAFIHQGEIARANITGFLDYKQKQRGDNVLDFFRERAKLQ